MEAWTTFWGWFLIFVLGVFGLLAIVITIGGFFDVKALFRTIDEQHHQQD